jgi:hypothetical protein
MIILQLLGIISGLCFMIGVPWATVDTIYRHGFDPSDLIIMPLVLALTIFGGALALVSFASMVEGSH